MIGPFRPPPDKPRLPGTAAQVRETYRQWRWRQLGLTFLAYAVYYFVRKNFSVAMPLVEKDLGISKADLGLFLTAHGILYGISKFGNGYLADRSNARTFLAFGLLVSAALNFGFGLADTVLAMGVLWCLNGWFQGMGFPPCARVLSHWFAPAERGTMWGIWNASHMVGAAVIMIWAGWLGQHYGWRWAFFGPAAVAVVVSFVIVAFLADTPGSVGLGPVEEFYGGEADLVKPEGETRTSEEESAEFKAFLRKRVFENPYIWLICIANFFVYTVRYGFLDWAPTYLHEVKDYELMQAGGMTAGFEMAGLVGSLAAGVLTDRYFRTHRAPICVAYMVGTCLAIIAFWKFPAGDSVLYDGVLLLSVGFLIYGPQFLVGVMTADIVTKRAAATAIGLTGLFGYLSGVLSGYGLGKILDTYGWDGGFLMLSVAAALSAVFFALCWNAGAQQDEEQSRPT